MTFFAGHADTCTDMLETCTYGHTLGVLSREFTQRKPSSHDSETKQISRTDPSNFHLFLRSPSCPPSLPSTQTISLES
jgi:hypothetical protein